jgi:hypothetical protein
MTELPPTPPEPEPPFSPYGPAETLDVAPPPSRRRGIVIGATAAVLAVVAGAAVYAAGVLSGGGRQPDELVPRTTFAYAKVDLDPAAGQKLAARSFFGKFPDVKTGGGDDVFESVIGDVVSDGDVDYDRDVKPWFDRRAAVAAFPGAGGKPTVVSVLRSKDDAKARSSLDRLAARTRTRGVPFAYDLAKGYVVLSDTAAHVADAIRESGEASLRDNETYRKDVDALTGDQVAVAWTDVAQSFRAALAGVPQAGLLPTAVTDQVKGRAVMGVHFTGDYVELEGRLFDSKGGLITAGGKPDLLDRLPASTVAAASISGIDKAIDDALALTGTDPDQIAGGLIAQTGLSLANDLLPLLGNETVLAAGSLGLTSDPRVGLLSKVANTAKAKVAGDKIVSALTQLGDIPAKAAVKDGTFFLAVPRDYADELTGSPGGLTSSPKFTKAVGDLGTPSMVLYVDLEAALEGRRGPEEALRSFGAVAGYEGDVGYFRARLVVG